jgi:hypothetical protein
MFLKIDEDSQRKIQEKREPQEVKEEKIQSQK